MDTVSIYKNNLTFEEAENIILKAKKLANDYYYVNEMLSNLYIEKGDAFKKFENYDSAFSYYNKAKKIYPENIRLIEKYNILSEKLISESDIALKNEEYALTIELLNFVLIIKPNKKDELQPIINDLYEKITDTETKLIKEKIKNIVQNKKNELENSFNKKILIGMSSNEVINSIGEPTLKDIMEKGGRQYELWTYQNSKKQKKIYFENNLVIKVE